MPSEGDGRRQSVEGERRRGDERSDRAPLATNGGVEEAAVGVERLCPVASEDDPREEEATRIEPTGTAT